NQNPSVSLDCEGVRVGIVWQMCVECRVQISVRIHSGDRIASDTADVEKDSTHYDLAIALRRQGTGEARDPSKLVSRPPPRLHEVGSSVGANEKLSLWQECQGVHLSPEL